MPFCHDCGKELPAQTAFCSSCGASAQEKRRGKDKTVSVLLAVFLSFWTWVYTYKKDAWKFWVGLTASILPVVVAMYMSISMAGRLSGSEAVAPAQKAEVMARTIDDGLGGLMIAMLACIGVGVVTWIWAIVDALAKKRDWYDSYRGRE